MQDQVDTIRSICIGISAHQKLELLSTLVKLLGYESLAVFGDCFDEVGDSPPAVPHATPTLDLMPYPMLYLTVYSMINLMLCD